MSTCSYGRSLSCRLHWKNGVFVAGSITRQVRRFGNNAKRAQNKPLRILFCGSDNFSIASLRALNNYRSTGKGDIKSIDVATRTDKRTGRGLKTITPPPIKAAAKELGLQLHQFDTFTGWTPPRYGNENINLVIAVSFGLLVPARILNGCEFGGINIHPSLLPDLKGATPIEHAIINGYTHTGVSVQTMHPSKFDEGAILDQSPWPGIAIPHPDVITASKLKDILAPIAADMLVKCISDGSYLPDAAHLPVTQVKSCRAAPKIKPEMKRLDFTKLTAKAALRLNRAISKLWSHLQTSDGESVRVQCGTGLRYASDVEIQDIGSTHLRQIAPGRPFAVVEHGKDIRLSTRPLLVKAADNQVLAIPTITVPGLPERPAAAAAARSGFLEEPVTLGNFEMYRGHGSLPEP